MSLPHKTLLVTGATGKQGGAVISSILASTQASFNIIGLTRNSASDGARRLAALPGVSVVGPVWGIFSVLVNSNDEERYGKAMHFVYASGDRGGPAKSNFDLINVKNFAAKWFIAYSFLDPAVYVIANMVKLFREDGYGGDIKASCNIYLGIKDFWDWIEENKGKWTK
ncbi:hypothetical protein B0J15DRAFT_498251 [Fusarium solani]|uniref:NmrA-like domain-containing protein n=1 Tax=Fusarium solani TaxID=169388 RepID=A0A9P9K512_FUSSL|nr:uncharacterized protein B0J15DRAFT_498251 [Fusarium solani]KAH7248248.1 hypothetical protein B0J15DRAFT_498251 [Fusarium solani]